MEILYKLGNFLFRTAMLIVRGSLWMVVGGLLTISWLLDEKPGIDQIELTDKLHGVEIKKGHYPIVKLARERDGEVKFFCSGYVADKHYIITAAHCLGDKFGSLKEGNVEIWNANNEKLADATPAGMNNRVDYGILHGDFSKFKTITSEFYADGFNNPFATYVSCGYPYGQRRITCVNFRPKGPTISGMGFSRLGTSTMLPGMSGGPVINKTANTVVAVNSAGHPRGVIVAPLMGLLGAFDIEP